MALLIIRTPFEFFDQMLAHTNYAFINRTSSLANLSNWFINFYWIPLTIVCVYKIFVDRKHHNLFVLLIGITFVGIYAANTGGIIKPANIYLWGIQMAVAFIVVYQTKLLDKSSFKENSSLRSSNLLCCIGKEFSSSTCFYTFLCCKKSLHYLCVILLMITSILFTFISLKQGLQLKTWTYFIEDTLGDYAIKSKPFEGWICHRKQGKPLDEMVKMIKDHIPKDQTILNLTDMYIIYALTQRESFRGITIAFWKNETPAAGRQRDQVRKNILENLPGWIIAHGASYKDQFVNLGIKEEILNSYTPMARSGAYLLLKRNK